MAALESVGSLPNYRATPTQSQYNLTPPGNTKRYSRTLTSEINSSTLTGASYNRPDSPSENEYSRSYNRPPNTRNLTSPLDSSRSNNFHPITPGSGPYPSRTPRTPHPDYKGAIGSPQISRSYHRSSPSLDHGIMSLETVRQVSNSLDTFCDGVQTLIMCGC